MVQPTKRRSLLKNRKLDDISVSKDFETVFCVVDNEAGNKEVILLRVIIERGEKYSHIYCRPGSPPQPARGDREKKSPDPNGYFA